MDKSIEGSEGIKGVVRGTSQIITKSYFKFANMNDYIQGMAEMEDMLNIWRDSSDEGFDRKFEIIPHTDSLKFELVMEVNPHDIPEEN